MGAATDYLANAPSDPEFGIDDESPKLIVDFGILAEESLLANLPGRVFPDLSSPLVLDLL